VSFIDPKKSAEDQEVADWQEEWVRMMTAQKDGLDEFSKYVQTPPNDMVLDIRMRMLVEFLLPAHNNRVTDPFSEAAMEEAPTNIERLQYDVSWREKLVEMLNSIIAQFHTQAAQAGIPTPNGKTSGLVIAQPGEAAAAAEEILRRKGK
jgi:hypothetical protein